MKYALIISLGLLVAAAQGEPTRPAILQGTLSRFILDANGEPDGFLLNNGTEVHVAPYLSEKLVTAMHTGEIVRVTGYRASHAPFMDAQVVTSTLDNETVTDTGAPPEWSAPPAEVSVASTVSGNVKRPLHDSRGQVNGAILDDGTIVRLPEQFSPDDLQLYKAGQALQVRGQEMDTLYGRVVRIQTISSADKSGERPEASAAPGTPAPPPFR